MAQEIITLEDLQKFRLQLLEDLHMRFQLLFVTQTALSV